MKKIFVLFLLTFLSACVSEETAVSEAQDLFPECSEFRALKHHYGSGHESYSRTKVKMDCPKGPVVKVIKCDFGFGIISDTTCWENN